MNSTMYRQHILELYKNPENFGSLKDATHEKEKLNPVCGDEIKIQLKVENGIVKNAKFLGKGCAISIAAASLLTEKIKNLSIKEIEKINFDDIKDMMKIDITLGRIKCATLCLEAVKGSLR